MRLNEGTKMDEKLKFVPRFLDGDKVDSLCTEFGISRVTGHKSIERYKDSDLEAFTNRSNDHSVSQSLTLPGGAIDCDPQKGVPDLG